MRPPLFLAFLLALAAVAFAHPIPDIPVQGTFDETGSGTVRVEFDLRFLDAEPATAPYFKNEFLPDKPAEWRTAAIEKARAFVAANMEFFLVPSGQARPEWQWAFTGMKNAPLTTPEDPVMLTGTWIVPAGSTGYQLRSTPENKWSVLFLNNLRGKDLDRTQVLFPGEKSFLLELTAPSAAATPTSSAKADSAPWWRRLFGS